MTFLPLQKKVSPRWRQACKSELKIVWIDWECPMASRFVVRMSRVIEMLVAKLKWIGSGRNSYRFSRLVSETIGMCRISVNSFVAGVYKCETLIWKRSKANFTNGMRFFFLVTWTTWFMMPSRTSCGRAPGASRWCWADLKTFSWWWTTNWNFFSMASVTLEED